MFVPFESLPDNAKIWIYQSSRIFSATEKTEISTFLSGFLENWTAHDATLKASFDIKHDFFIVIGVDENYNNVSGCSIDKQVHVMKELGTKMGIDFFNRMNIARITDGRIETGNLHEFTDLIRKGIVKDDVKIFNNLVTTVSEYKKTWTQPIRESWIQNFISA